MFLAAAPRDFRTSLCVHERHSSRPPCFDAFCRATPIGVLKLVALRHRKLCIHPIHLDTIRITSIYSLGWILPHIATPRRAYLEFRYRLQGRCVCRMGLVFSLHLCKWMDYFEPLWIGVWEESFGKKSRGEGHMILAEAAIQRSNAWDGRRTNTAGIVAAPPKKNRKSGDRASSLPALPRPRVGTPRQPV